MLPKSTIVALGIDANGAKHVLGFWESAMKNHEICLELLNSLVERGLHLTRDILYVTFFIGAFRRAE
jgi:transposase-like protein